MPRLLAYPVRLGLNGAFETVEDGEDYYPQEIANLVQTQPGERPLAPEYGLNDPTFSTLDEIELHAKIELFGPPVVLSEVVVTDIGNNYASVEVEFDIIEDDTEDDYDDYDVDEYNDVDVETQDY